MNALQVGIDITSLVYDRGVSRYTSNLARALAKRRDVQLSFYGNSLRQIKPLEDFYREVSREARLSPYFYLDKSAPRIHELMWLHLQKNPVKKLLPHIKVFHSWDWLQPPDRQVPLVSTIHDVAIMKYSETAHPKILQMHQSSWKTLKERNAQIIAVSHSTRKDCIELLGFHPSQVHTIYEALPTEMIHVGEALTEDEQESIKVQLELTKPFILFVGTREPRKNLLQLIKAWQPLAKEVELVIAGESGWDGVEEQLGNQHQGVRFLGKVSAKQLAVLYSEAEVFVYPSLYEGFGLPILEAFYFGTPVVTSNVAAMPEVAGNAAELIDPLSVESIRQGIVKVLGESHDEQKLRLQKMIIRLHLFDWKQVAEQTLQVYKRAVDQWS